MINPALMNYLRRFGDPGVGSGAAGAGVPQLVRAASLPIGDTGPPAATGVTPGPAYPNMSGEPTVIVQPPVVSPGMPAGPAPYVPPSWIPPAEQNNPAPGGYPAPAGPAAPDWAVNAAPNVPQQPGANYVDPRAANSFIGGLINWNGPGAANPTGREPGLYEDASPRWLAKHRIGALSAKLGIGGLAPSMGKFTRNQ